MRLRARGVRRAPIVGAHNEPLGLVSIDDLLAYLATTLMGLAGIVARQMDNERTNSPPARASRA